MSDNSILYPGTVPLSMPSERSWIEEEKSKHKAAFRTAFDTLNYMWPPENTNEYWKLVTDRMELLYKENADNALCRSLLIALTEYLERIGKEREKRYGHNGNPTDAGMDGG